MIEILIPGKTVFILKDGPDYPIQPTYLILTSHPYVSVYHQARFDMSGSKLLFCTPWNRSRNMKSVFNEIPLLASPWLFSHPITFAGPEPGCQGGRWENWTAQEATEWPLFFLHGNKAIFQTAKIPGKYASEAISMVDLILQYSLQYTNQWFSIGLQ